MNQKRKADLQRKLSMAPVATPPDGLAGRIKRDIPQYLMDVQNDRQRLSKAVAFNIRVAASIIVLVSSSFLVLFVMSRGPKGPQSMASIERSTADSAQKKNAPATPPSTVMADSAEVTETVAQTQAQKATLNGAPAARIARLESAETRGTALSRRDLKDEAANRERKETSAYEFSSRNAVASVAEVEEGTAGGVAGGAAGGAVAKKISVDRATTTKTASDAVADSVTAPAPPSAPAMAQTSPPPPSAATVEPSRANAAAEDKAVTSLEAPARPSEGRIKSAQTTELDLPARTLFGISVDRSAFERLKRVIETGQKPASKLVDVGALVNYFAGSVPAKRDVQMEVEASHEPLADPEHATVLRYSIDTSHADVPAGGSVPPAITDAQLEIEVNSDAVTNYRIVSGTGLIVSEPTVLKNASVTGLIELHLKPAVRRRQNIALVRLTYRSVADGRQHEILRIVRAGDAGTEWIQASHRHRLATLGATWGESLQGTAGGGEVARTAEELASEAPRDSRARELAKAANASSRLRSSAPTGSGR